MHMTRDILEALLKEASVAHHNYEKQRGERDDEWAAWYADYIIERLSLGHGSEHKTE